MGLVDPRIKKQAQVLVDYSLKVKIGENVLIFSDFVGRPLVTELYKLLVKRGAGEIKLRFDSNELHEIYYKNSTSKQRKLFPQISYDEIKKIDCWIGIICTTNTRGLAGVDASVISRRAKVVKPITEWRVDKTRWVLTEFPSSARAQEADMSITEYENFVFSAINNVDWKKKFKEQEKLRKLVDRVKEVHIVGSGTDLKLGIEGRKAENAGGNYNMPDGEVFTSVIENQANGYISFTYPALYLGREYNDIRLEFENGKIIKANASKGKRDLNKILDTDPGARRIGELGLGNNYKITKFTKNTLFDEKIGGSIHIALGNGFKETLSKNKSVIHWDMVKDLRNGGEIRFDGKKVQKNGKWLFSGG